MSRTLTLMLRSPSAVVPLVMEKCSPPKNQAPRTETRRRTFASGPEAKVRIARPATNQTAWGLALKSNNLNLQNWRTLFSTAKVSCQRDGRLDQVFRQCLLQLMALSLSSLASPEKSRMGVPKWNSVSCDN